MNMSRMYDIFLLLLLLRRTCSLPSNVRACLCGCEWECMCQCENTSQDPANHRSKNEISKHCIRFCTSALCVWCMFCGHARCSLLVLVHSNVQNRWNQKYFTLHSLNGNIMFNSVFLRQSMLEKTNLNCCVYFDTTCIGMEWNGNDSSTCININETCTRLWNKITKRANRNRDSFADLHLQIHHCHTWWYRWISPPKPTLLHL